MPYLEDPDPLVAEIAYGEIASAPYVTLRTLKDRLDAPTLRRWTGGIFISMLLMGSLTALGLYLVGVDY